MSEHEVDEGSGRGPRCGFADSAIVFPLMKTDDVLDGDRGKFPATGTLQDGLPKAVGAAVAVGERMNEFELVLEDAALDNHRCIIDPPPGKEVR